MPTALSSILVAAIGAVAGVSASFFTAQATANDTVSDLDTRITVVEERENNHYMEVQKALERIEKKIDQL